MTTILSKTRLAMLGLGLAAALAAPGLAQAATPSNEKASICDSAWNKDPVFGVTGIQSGPRG